MPENRLLLWDIDGTLITTGAAGHSAIALATAKQFEGGELSGVEIAGRTDIGIAHQILAKYKTPVTDESVHSLLDLYVDFLTAELPKGKGRVLPGVQQLLEYAAKSPGKTIGLLTGNLERGAKLKLEQYQLWHFFPFGAFADDHHDRNELGSFALARAWQATGIQFAPAQVDVIGDTAHDINCGKAIGARTVAVATGSWSREQLAEHQPDFLFDDLANVDEVIGTLGW